MKILGIAGSLRSGSYNGQLLQLAAETLPDGVELAVWEGLRDLPAFDEDTEGTPSLAVAGFRSAVADADAVLIATPEYNGSIPGALKNALDWGSRPRETARVPRQARRRDRREPRRVRRRLGAGRDPQDPRHHGRARRRGRALARQGPRAARGARRELVGQLRAVVDLLVDEAAARAEAA